MNEEEIARLEELARAATPGPWTAGSYSASDYDSPGGVCIRTIAKYRLPWWHPDHAAAPMTLAMTTDFSFAQEQQEADAEFMAALSPSVVLRLLAELRRLRAIETAAQHHLNSTHEHFHRDVTRCRNCTETWEVLSAALSAPAKED